MSHCESPRRSGKDTSWTGSLPPQQLTSWPADSSPPGLQSSSRWPCPLLVRPESCSLCPGNRKEKCLIRGFPTKRNYPLIPSSEIHFRKRMTKPFWKCVSTDFSDSSLCVIRCCHNDISSTHILKLHWPLTLCSSFSKSKAFIFGCFRHHKWVTKVTNGCLN